MNYLVKEETARYKAGEKGIKSLTNVELLAMLLASDQTSEGLEIARNLYKRAGSLLGVTYLTSKDIMSEKGIGQATAASILAAFELGRRVRSEAVEKKIVDSAITVHEYMHQFMDGLDHEECYVLLLRQDLSLIKPVRISSGGRTGTVVDVRMVLRAAIENKAVAMILVHNHPSGRVYPSGEDDRLTRRIQDAGRAIDIPLRDHVIYARDSYYSYSEQGVL